LGQQWILFGPEESDQLTVDSVVMVEVAARQEEVEAIQRAVVAIQQEVVAFLEWAVQS